MTRVITLTLDVATTFQQVTFNKTIGPYLLHTAEQ